MKHKPERIKSMQSIKRKNHTKCCICSIEGDNHEECKEVSDKTKKADNCNACVVSSSVFAHF